MISSPPLQHIAIIMDGNGRWAKQRGLSRSEGHRAGTEAVRAVITECRSIGLPHLTLYAFSKENWNRPMDEIHFLFDLLVDFLGREIGELRRQNIRLLTLGEPSELPLPARKTLEHACQNTRDNTAMILNLALNYSGRFELARACRRLIEEGVAPASVTPERLAEKLYTAGQPDPDLIIRTSGEKRISNFLLFQCAYSEFYFTDTLWPDFTPGELQRAIADYAGRSRRFGATGGASSHDR